MTAIDIHPIRLRTGCIVFEKGAARDYQALAHHHYRIKRPATFAAIARAIYIDRASRQTTLAGVAVLSWPVPMCVGRIRWFNLDSRDYGHCLKFANDSVRTISRVVVHPHFRSAGVAVGLCRWLTDACDARYVESSAHLARFSNFLEHSGFKKFDFDPFRPAYFILDKQEQS